MKTNKELSIEEKKLKELRLIRYMLEDIWLSNEYVRKEGMCLSILHDRLKDAWRE